MLNVIVSVKQLHCHNQRKLPLNGPSGPSVGLIITHLFPTVSLRCWILPLFCTSPASSIDCLVLHFRHLDGHAFNGGPGPWGYASSQWISNISESAPFSLLKPAQSWMCWLNLYYYSSLCFCTLLPCHVFSWEFFKFFLFLAQGGPEVHCNPGSSQPPKGDNTLPNL